MIYVNETPPFLSKLTFVLYGIYYIIMGNSCVLALKQRNAKLNT